jgi:hypothetical protein
VIAPLTARWCVGALPLRRTDRTNCGAFSALTALIVVHFSCQCMPLAGSDVLGVRVATLLMRNWETSTQVKKMYAAYALRMPLHEYYILFEFIRRRTRPLSTQQSERRHTSTSLAICPPNLDMGSAGRVSHKV